MFGFLSLGFFVGMAHAFEADHVAAVSSLVSGKSRPLKMLKYGAFWGLGHTISLMVVGGIILMTGLAIGVRLSHEIEALVGLMLLGLGAHVLYRLIRDRVHFHHHTHEDGSTHLHLHSHKQDGSANPVRHEHLHPDRTAIRSLLVGIMHGLAGSAALVLIAAASTNSVFFGLGYIAIFGAGSILGMAGMSLAIALPLTFTARLMSKTNTILQLAIGVTTISIGGMILLENARILANV
jgi:cytochrome c biogenesis protein CcdA